MAFFIITTEGLQYTWHIQSPKKKFPNADAHVAIISVLQADGDELDQIRMRFVDLPITKGNICTWRGSLAQFIYDNL